MSNFNIENFPTAKECNVQSLSNKMIETDLEYIFYTILGAVTREEKEIEIGVVMPIKVVPFLKEKGFKVEVVNTSHAALYEMNTKKKLLKISWE